MLLPVCDRTDDGAMIGKLLRQQAAIAAFGTFALRNTDLLAVLNEAARVCADGLNVPFTKVARYCAAQNELVIEAGFGWNQGVIGYIVPHPDGKTPQGRAFSTGLPVICNILLNEDAFVLPDFYAEHGIVSTIDVVIPGVDRPYGVLEIDSDKLQDYDQHDIVFLTGFANVLAEAVATAERTRILSATVDQMTQLMADKDRLMADKDRLIVQRTVLAEELQHRVRNNLQLIGGMLTKQLQDTTDNASRRGLRAIIRRVHTLSQVYNQLLGSEMTRSIEFSAYLNALCVNLKEIQAPADGSIDLCCAGDPVILDLDVVTALGIIVAELVTNSFEHAFAQGGCMISIALHHDAGTSVATLTIQDDGIGFVPIADSKRHGIGLVHRLIEQIGGHARVEARNGTIWTATFPVDLQLNA